MGMLVEWKNPVCISEGVDSKERSSTSKELLSVGGLDVSW
jgi:hypothetical protein